MQLSPTIIPGTLTPARCVSGRDDCYLHLHRSAGRTCSWDAPWLLRSTVMHHQLPPLAGLAGRQPRWRYGSIFDQSSQPTAQWPVKLWLYMSDDFFHVRKPPSPRLQIWQPGLLLHGDGHLPNRQLLPGLQWGDNIVNPINCWR